MEAANGLFVLSIRFIRSTRFLCVCPPLYELERGGEVNLMPQHLAQFRLDPGVIKCILFCDEPHPHELV